MIKHVFHGWALKTRINVSYLINNLFHNSIMAQKIPEIQKIMEVRNILENQAKLRRLKSNQLAMSALTDIYLSIISPKILMEEILQFRHDNEKKLAQARQELARLTCEIRENPWKKEFAEELEVNAIPKIHCIKKESKKIRNSWLMSSKVKSAIKAAGLTVAFSSTLLLQVAVAPGVLGLISDHIIPGAELVLDWRNDRQEAMGNGLHYSINIKWR